MLKNNRGFTLLEILVALLIVSIGLLGVATLQVRGQQINYVAYYRSQATFLANDIIDKMRINFTEAANGNYVLEEWSDCPNSGNLSTACDTASCNPAALRNYDLANWCNALENTLPNAEAIITLDTTPVNEYKIRICWANILDTDKNGCGDEGKEEQVWYHVAPQMLNL